jgi:hypothetical protein
MKKEKKEKKAKKERNVFGFREGTNKSFISNMFLEDGVDLIDAAKKVEKALDKEKPKSISLVLSMVKRLIKKGHVVEVSIKATPATSKKKSKTPSKAKVPAKTNTKKEEVAEVKKEETPKE